ncbi:hypothetical protein ABZ721_10610 [Streptomyces sp. NPDC006733]|uniref:hypothetical protein n=1 Tax=Streptomyces sp. NPDC006733 TaxID=3155460 RepID=UPI0033EF04AE
MSTGAGHDDLARQMCSVDLHPLAFLAEANAPERGALPLQLDAGNPVSGSALTPVDPEKLYLQVNRMINPISWPQLLGNFLVESPRATRRMSGSGGHGSLLGRGRAHDGRIRTLGRAGRYVHRR